MYETVNKYLINMNTNFSVYCSTRESHIECIRKNSKEDGHQVRETRGENIYTGLRIKYAKFDGVSSSEDSSESDSDSDVSTGQQQK